MTAPMMTIVRLPVSCPRSGILAAICPCHAGMEPAVAVNRG